MRSCRAGVELLRQSDPDWFGTFSYSDADVVITVRAASDDGSKAHVARYRILVLPIGMHERSRGHAFCASRAPRTMLRRGSSTGLAVRSGRETAVKNLI